MATAGLVVFTPGIIALALGAGVSPDGHTDPAQQREQGQGAVGQVGPLVPIGQEEKAAVLRQEIPARAALLDRPAHPGVAPVEMKR